MNRNAISHVEYDSEKLDYRHYNLSIINFIYYT